jgi:hypothetical protein
MPVPNSIAFQPAWPQLTANGPKGDRDQRDKKDHCHGDKACQTSATDHWDTRCNRFSLGQPDDHVETDEQNSHDPALNQIRFWRIPARCGVVPLLYCTRIYNYG